MSNRTNINQYAPPTSDEVNNIQYSRNNQTISTNSTYLKNSIIVNGVKNLDSSNIIKNKTIFKTAGNVSDYQTAISVSDQYVGAVSYSDYKYIVGIAEITEVTSAPIFRSIFPSKMGCVFSDYGTNNLQLLGVRDDVLYLIDVGNKRIISQNIRTANPNWTVNIDNIDTTTLIARCDETGLYFYNNNKLTKYNNQGGVAWEQQRQIDYFEVIKDGVVILLTSTTNQIYYIDSDYGNVINAYTQQYFTIEKNNIYVDWISGYVVIHNVYNKSQSYRIIVLDKNGSVLYNLTSGLKFPYDYVEAIAITSQKQLLIVYRNNDYSFGDMYVITLPGLSQSTFAFNTPQFASVQNIDIKEVMCNRDSTYNGIYVILRKKTYDNQVFVLRIEYQKGNQGAFNQILEDKAYHIMSCMPQCCFDNNKIYYIAGDNINTNRVMGLCDNCTGKEYTYTSSMVIHY